MKLVGYCNACTARGNNVAALVVIICLINIDPPSAASEEPSHKVKSKREALADCQKKDT